MLHFLYSFITCVIALFFIFLGVITFLLPWIPTFSHAIIQFIEHYSWPWNLLGLGFVVIGGALIGNVWSTSRRRYHTVKNGSFSTTISETVVDDYLRSYFSNLFLLKEIPYRFVFKKRKLQITADLPFFKKEEQQPLIKKIEHDLLEIFTDFLGYKQPIELFISFDKKGPKN